MQNTKGETYNTNVIVIAFKLYKFHTSLDPKSRKTLLTTSCSCPVFTACDGVLHWGGDIQLCKHMHMNSFICMQGNMHSCNHTCAVAHTIIYMYMSHASA